MSRWLMPRVSSFTSAVRIAGATAALAVTAACGSMAPTAPNTELDAGAAAGSVSQPAPDSSQPTTPQRSLGATTLPAGNPTCAELATAHGGSGAAWFETKLDRMPGSSESFGDGVIRVTLTNGSRTGFDWFASLPVDAVLVKSGSDGNNLYLYSPEATSGTGLTTPNAAQDISHITVCYDVELEVSETSGATSFTRDYDWTISKSVDRSSITLASGGQETVNYAVAIKKDSGSDSNWKLLSGTITVRNPHPSIAASGIEVVDNLSGHGALAVSCPLGNLGPLASMTCSYDAVSLPDGSSRTNTTSASSTTYGIARAENQSAIPFVTPTTVHDNEVKISDSFEGAGLSDKAASSSQTFAYARTIAAAALTCGSNTIGNTATLADDDGTARTASASVTATLDCATAAPAPPPPAPEPAVVGCTRSQGYWGTHSSRGPAPYNDTWAKLGENTPFYTSGLTHYEQMQQPAKGNAYVILAAQFIAAKLNVLSGAAAPDGVSLSTIETFYNTYTPAEVGAMKGNDPVRKQALAWASTLDDYNNGRLNVSYCGS